jgi:hypothetical protein
MLRQLSDRTSTLMYKRECIEHMADLALYGYSHLLEKKSQRLITANNGKKNTSIFAISYKNTLINYFIDPDQVFLNGGIEVPTSLHPDLYNEGDEILELQREIDSMKERVKSFLVFALSGVTYKFEVYAVIPKELHTALTQKYMETLAEHDPYIPFIPTGIDLEKRLVSPLYEKGVNYLKEIEFAVKFLLTE